MKNILQLFIVLFLAVSLKAQTETRSLVVRYVSGYLELSDSLKVNLLKTPPLYHPINNYELSVTDSTAYVHHYLKEKERLQNSLGKGFKTNNAYFDLKDAREYRQYIPVYGDRRRYLVDGLFKVQQYDLLQDSINILGYTCYKAKLIYYEDRGKNYVWYTPQLSYPLSPNGFTGLPGLVLATERIYNGIRTATIAQSINPENRKLTKPTKGLPISQKEYDDLLVLWGLKQPD